MKTYLDCVPCIIRQTLDSVRMTVDNERIHAKVLHKVLDLCSEMEFSQSPPAMAQVVHRFIRDVTGVADPYLEVKNRLLHE